MTAVTLRLRCPACTKQFTLTYANFYPGRLHRNCPRCRVMVVLERVDNPASSEDAGSAFVPKEHKLYDACPECGGKRNPKPFTDPHRKTEHHKNGSMIHRTNCSVYTRQSLRGDEVAHMVELYSDYEAREKHGTTTAADKTE